MAVIFVDSPEFLLALSYYGCMKTLACGSLFMACSLMSAQTPPVTGTGTGDLVKARVFTPEQGDVRTMANGGQSRDVLHGTLLTGETLGVHESMQLAGTKPNPPHTIAHSELILVREGTLAFEHDGLTENAVAGSIIYVAYGTLHTVRNMGDTPAKYVVIAIGAEPKK